MPRQGEDFHKLVEHLEWVLSKQGNVTIESPKYVPDKITGASREHDIVLTQREVHRTYTTAIEVRDRSRKVTVNQIEEFHTKCRDTGIDKGVVVSSKGFFDTARIKAAHYNIDCLMLEEIEHVVWMSPEVRVTTPTMVHIELFFDVTPPVNGTYRPYYYSEDNGCLEEATDEIIKAMFMPLWQAVPHSQLDETSGVVPVEISNPTDVLLIDESGVEHHPQKVTATIHYEMRVSYVYSPVQYHRYKFADSEEISETISSHLDVPGFSGTIMVLKKGDLLTNLSWKRDPE